MAGPTKKKQQREEKTDEQSAFITASNSIYNTLTPMMGAEHVRFHHPHKGISIHCPTGSDEFFELFSEFASKGLREKMMSELECFAETIDPKWSDVLASVKEREQAS